MHLPKRPPFRSEGSGAPSTGGYSSVTTRSSLRRASPRARPWLLLTSHSARVTRPSFVRAVRATKSSRSESVERITSAAASRIPGNSNGLGILFVFCFYFNLFNTTLHDFAGRGKRGLYFYGNGYLYVRGIRSGELLNGFRYVVFKFRLLRKEYFGGCWFLFFHCGNYFVY